MDKLRKKITNAGILAKVCLLLFLMMLLTFLAIVSWTIFWGDNSLHSMKILQMLQTLCTFLIPCIAAAYAWSDNGFKWLKLDSLPNVRNILIVILLMIFALPAINLLGYWNEQLQLPEFLKDLEQLMKSQEEAAAELTEKFIKADNYWMLLGNILLMALLPAISEEVCFRGTLQQLFDHNSRHHIAIWTAAIIFSAIHFQFYGFIPRMLIGALFGYILLWTNNLWLPIIAHFTNNAAAVIMYNIYYMQGLSVDEVEALGTKDTAWLGWSSLVVTALMIYFCYKTFNKNLNKRDKE